jgi:RimJ/RimL family protein N-acetyltransferase
MAGKDVLQTERLVLREMETTDADALLAVLGDPETMVHYPRPFDRDAVGRWIDRARRSYADRGFGLYAVILRESGELIGDCGYLLQEIHGRSEVELSYHIGRRHWNRGLATEGARACVRHAFTTLALERLVALVRPKNLQSRRVAEKAGLAVESECDHKGLHHLVYAISRTSERGADAGAADFRR